MFQCVVKTNVFHLDVYSGDKAFLAFPWVATKTWEFMR